MNVITSRNGIPVSESATDSGQRPAAGPARDQGPKAAFRLASWLREGRRLLEEASGHAVAGPVVVAVRGADAEISYTLTAGAVHAGQVLSLSTFEREVWEALGSQELTAKVLAARIHRKADSSFRLLLANFVDRSPAIIEAGRRGYRRIADISEVAAPV